MTFSTRFKANRAQSDLSQEQVAKSLGYNSCQFISNIERGKSYLPKEALKKLCIQYGWNFDEMVKEIIKEKCAVIAEEWK